MHDTNVSNLPTTCLLCYGSSTAACALTPCKHHFCDSCCVKINYVEPTKHVELSVEIQKSCCPICLHGVSFPKDQIVKVIILAIPILVSTELLTNQKLF